MLKNLRAEMARIGLTRKEVAFTIGVTEQTFSNKLRGACEFTVNEALKIHEKYFKIIDFKTLFTGGENE